MRSIILKKVTTGFMVFDTPKAKVGCAICWDQWFPECARILNFERCRS